MLEPLSETVESVEHCPSCDVTIKLQHKPGRVFNWCPFCGLNLHPDPEQKAQVERAIAELADGAPAP